MERYDGRLPICLFWSGTFLLRSLAAQGRQTIAEDEQKAQGSSYHTKPSKKIHPLCHLKIRAPLETRSATAVGCANRAGFLDVFNYILINYFQYIKDVIYVLFDAARECGFLQRMATLLTGDLIRAARGLIGLSQSVLAKKAGITQKALSEFELGRKPITAKANEKLRRVFEEEHVQFIAANIAESHIAGAGVRWKIAHPYTDIKII